MGAFLIFPTTYLTRRKVKKLENLSFVQSNPNNFNLLKQIIFVYVDHGNGIDINRRVRAIDRIIYVIFIYVLFSQSDVIGLPT